jgi:Fe-S oxidoreductase
VNFLTQLPGLNAISKRALGVAPQRPLPKFSARTFKRWFVARRPQKGSRRVILWADTFNNHFRSETAIAAAEVLEAASCQVIVPPQDLCCGRPLYDFGMLDIAKRQLDEILVTLRDEIAAGTTIVGLEPACVTTFKDELLNLFPDNADARKLSKQVVLFSDFLVNSVDWKPRALNVKAVVHGHCHQKSVLGMNSDCELLRRLGVKFELLDSGCCGMAGSFGYTPEHYEVSLKAGELGGLLPAVRAAHADTLVVANGYSCRQQIEQCTGRATMHIAEVARRAITA